MERWRPALVAWPGNHAQSAGAGRLSTRAMRILRTLVFGPWVLWHKTYPNRQVKVILRQRLLGLAFLASVVVYLLVPGLATVTALAGLGGILVWSYLWARRMAAKVTAQRRLRFHAVQVGDELEETFQLVNNSGSEVLWAEVVDASSMPGYSVSSVRAADAHQTVDWRANAICTQRGVFQLGPWDLLLGDPFGVFRVIQTYSERNEILVYPPLADLPRRILPHQRMLGDHRPLRQPLPAETIQAITARPFNPGDPLRHIHWRTSARKDKLFSKQFEPEAASRVWLIPDFDARVHLTSAGESTLETTITLTATLAALLLNEQIAVGLAVYADQQSVSLPQRGPAQLWPILLALAPLKAVYDLSLAQTLAQVRPLIHARDLVILITPSLAADWPPLLRRLSGGTQGGAASVYLLDPASYGAKESAQSHIPLLAGLGIQAQLIRRGDVRLRQAAYGPLSRWEFKTLATGRVIVQSAPRGASEAIPGMNRLERDLP